MDKPISREMHGLADYGYAAFLSSAPETMGFKSEENAVLACRLMGSGAMLYSLFTKAEWGLVRKMSFKTHMVIDVVANTAALGLPWLLGFAHNKRARNTVLAAAATGLLVSALTRVEEMEEDTNAG